jgi:hypothetical protein
MSGLRRICRLYGAMQVGSIKYLWDYVAEEPVEEKDMRVGSERWKASERKRAELLKQQSK